VREVRGKKGIRKKAGGAGKRAYVSPWAMHSELKMICVHLCAPTYTTISVISKIARYGKERGDKHRE